MTTKQEREARLAARLRENLKRRKVTARGEHAAEEKERDPGSRPG